MEEAAELSDHLPLSYVSEKEVEYVGFLRDAFGTTCERLRAEFSEGSRFTLDTKLVPSWTDVQGVVGEQERHRPEDLILKREQEIAFRLAKLVLEKYFRLDGSQRKDRENSLLQDGEVKAWLFPDAFAIAQRWVAEWVTLKDNAFKGMLLLVELAHDAADRIYHAIARTIAGEGEKRLVPILQPYDTVGSTKYVDFDTSRPLYRTREDKCHLNHVVCDTDQWEQKVAQALEEMPQVRCYVKNQNLGFEIPYTLGGQEHRYVPDFLVKWDDGQPEPLNLILECSGEKRRDKEAKVATALNQWVPAVNNHGGFGRWAFVEVGDPWNTESDLKPLITHACERAAV